MPVATRLYYGVDDPAGQALTEFSATVTDVRLERRDATGQFWQVALDRTAFYPESGGQPWDTGTLEAVARSGARLEVPVLRVTEDEAGEIWHTCAKPLLECTEIRGLINPTRRLDHRQQHTGQHLLSAVFLSELNAPTISFHLDAESSTIDLMVESLSSADLARVEDRVNALIAEDRPVRVHQVSRAEAEAMLARGDLRKLPEREGDMRLVEIAGIEFNACGGTHLHSLGAIGGLTLRRTERVRHGLRVEFCCGLRAVHAARRDYETLGVIAAGLSVGPADAPGRVVALQDELKAATKERRALLEQMAGFEAQSILSENSASTAGQLLIHEVEGREVAYARALAAKIAVCSPKLTVLLLTPSAERLDLVLARGVEAATHCGEVLRAALATVEARGGGAAELAQGAIPVARRAEFLAAIHGAFVPSTPAG